MREASHKGLLARGKTQDPRMCFALQMRLKEARGRIWPDAEALVDVESSGLHRATVQIRFDCDICYDVATLVSNWERWL